MLPLFVRGANFALTPVLSDANCLASLFAGPPPLSFIGTHMNKSLITESWRWRNPHRLRAMLNLRSGRMSGGNGAGLPSLPQSSILVLSWPAWSRSTRRLWRRSPPSKDWRIRRNQSKTPRKTPLSLHLRNPTLRLMEIQHLQWTRQMTWRTGGSIPCPFMRTAWRPQVTRKV